MIRPGRGGRPEDLASLTKPLRDRAVGGEPGILALGLTTDLQRARRTLGVPGLLACRLGGAWKGPRQLASWSTSLAWASLVGPTGCLPTTPPRPRPDPGVHPRHGLIVGSGGTFEQKSRGRVDPRARSRIRIVVRTVVGEGASHRQPQADVRVGERHGPGSPGRACVIPIDGARPPASASGFRFPTGLPSQAIASASSLMS